MNESLFAVGNSNRLTVGVGGVLHSTKDLDLRVTFLFAGLLLVGVGDGSEAGRVVRFLPIAEGLGLCSTSCWSCSAVILHSMLLQL